MKNLEFLKDQLKYTGFGEGFDAQLREKIDKQLPEFQLNHRAEYDQTVALATLNYSKSASSDMYFLNNYSLEFVPEHLGKLTSQTFRIGKENNITLKEAFNLMNGRPVYKEWTKLEKQGEGENTRYVPTEEKYQGWKEMNFKEVNKNGNFKFETYTDNYGYKLEEVLRQLPLKEVQNEVHAKRLLESLQKGNLQSVTRVIDDIEQKAYVAANPQFKRIDLYDANMKKIQLDNKQNKTNKENQGQNKSGSKPKRSRKKAA